MSRWFRFYDNAVNDPKVQTLPDRLFKLWVNILCIASKHSGQLPSNDALSYALRCRWDRLDIDLQELIKRRLIDDIDGKLSPHNWPVRQYKSDISTDRVQHFRQRKRNVSSAVSVTPPEYRVQNTDTEKKESKSRASRARARTPLPEYWTLDEKDSAYAQGKGFIQPQILLMADAFANHHRAKGNLMANWRAAWRMWCSNEIKFQRTNNGGFNATNRKGGSVSHAAGRLAEQGFEFGPRPSLVATSKGSNVMRLLPERRGG